MTRAIPIAAAAGLLAGCADVPPVTAVPPDAGVVTDALIGAQPEPLVDLVEDTAAFLPLDAGCPTVELDGDRERFSGGCALADGTEVLGSLTRYDDGDAAWLAGDGFALRQDGETTLFFDGAVELQREGDLLYVEAATTMCGAGSLDCADGVVRLDLSFTLFPVGNYPASYDATVSGVVSVAGEAPIAVEGAWSIDGAACENEPASGIFALRRGEAHALELDGADACDGCAAWAVQGVSAGSFCDIAL